jgi:hypothetical protein
VLSGRIEPPMLDSMLEQNDGVSAEEIYVNRKVLDLVTKAEMEREDYRRKTSPNVFFGTRKTYLGTKYNTLWINSIVILFTLVAHHRRRGDQFEAAVDEGLAVSSFASPAHFSSFFNAAVTLPAVSSSSRMKGSSTPGM